VYAQLPADPEFYPYDIIMRARRENRIT
jgi:hypothetical protein